MRGNSLFRPSLFRRSFNFRSFSSSSSFNLNLDGTVSNPRRDSSRSDSDSSPYGSSPYGEEMPGISGPQFTFVPKSLSEPPKFSFEYEMEEPPVPPNFAPVASDEEFEKALNKAEAESQLAMFYFTAKYCAPCRFIGPVLEELARRNPEVTTYKLDIEEAALANTVKKLNITTVPTVHYFMEGQKKDEVIGPDAARIVQTVKRLYGIGEATHNYGEDDGYVKEVKDEDDGYVKEVKDEDDGEDEDDEILVKEKVDT